MAGTYGGDNINSQSRAYAVFRRLSHFSQHIGRVTEIAKVLIKFGVDDLLIRLGFNDFIYHLRTMVGLKESPEAQLERSERVRLAMEELGVVFIKWGQFLSTRDDLVPEEYLHQFALLQNAVPPVPFEEIEGVLKNLINTGEIKNLSKKPLAAASVGQVHEALLAGGEEIVVKIRRPGIKRQVSSDLEILMGLAVLVEKHLPMVATTKPTVMVSEFSRGLLAELDFTQEAVNIERFGRFYAGNPRVKVPKIYRSLCSDQVLVMEKVSGLKFNDVTSLKEAGYDLKELAVLGAEIVFEQIIRFGYFHADPHPGNLLVQPGLRVALLDFGLVGRLNRRTRDTLLDLTMAVVRHKPRVVTRNILKLVNVESEEPPDIERLEIEVELFMESYVGRPIKDLNLSHILNDMVNIAAQYQLSLPPDLMLLAKALSQVEGLGIRLDPEFDINNTAKPFVLDEYKRRLSPSFWGRRLKDYLLEAGDFLQHLPRDMRPMYNMMRSGRIKAEFQLDGMEHMRQTVDRASYRLSFAIVLASLVIGSSVMVHANVPPKWHDLPVLGLIGFLAAAVVGFWLLYDFLKNRRF